MITLSTTHIITIAIFLLSSSYVLLKVILYYYNSEIKKIKEQIIKLSETISNSISRKDHDIKYNKVLSKLEESEKEIYEIIREDKKEVNDLLMRINGVVENIKGKLDRLS